MVTEKQICNNNILVIVQKIIISYGPYQSKAFERELEMFLINLSCVTTGIDYDAVKIGI